MSDETYFKELTTKLSQARIFLSGDARTAVVDGIDVDILVSKIIEGQRLRRAQCSWTLKR